MSRLTERINNVPDGESGVWVKNHDYITAAEKLADYEDLAEQGLLLRLPCKVGTDVFTIERSEVGTFYVRQSKVVMFEVFNTGLEVRLKFTNKIETYAINRIFLTQAEAEEKLRKLK